MARIKLGDIFEVKTAKGNAYLHFIYNRKKIVEQVSSYPVNGFEKPQFMRTEHYVRGELSGWHIINTDTWERQLVTELTPEQKKLSPWGVWNDTLLIENLEDDWSLESWD